MKKSLGIAAILIATAIVFSSFAIATDLKVDSELEALIKVQEYVNNYKTINNLNRDEIVWDNGGIDNTSAAMASQLDTVCPFNAQVADDFQFEADTLITDVHWWGVFWNPGSGPNPADFNIILYADEGGIPTGAGMPDPTPTALKVYNVSGVLGVPIGVSNEYEYEVVLPEPFMALANEKYWIAIQWIGVFTPQWGWSTNGANPDLLSLAVQGFPIIPIPFWTVHQYGDQAFYLTSKGPPEPVICCDGTLSWSEVNAGATVNGTFQVSNCGDPGSFLNWEVDSWPTWGLWTFTPLTGIQLEKGESIEIAVKVVAPPEKKKTFTGKVKMINSDDPTDFCEIDVSLTTPRNGVINGFTLLQWILQRYPNMFLILRNIFT